MIKKEWEMISRRKMVSLLGLVGALGSVQEAGAALVELLAAVTAAEPAIALRGAL
jgi:hypothetical protein